MVRRHHQLNGHEFQQILGDSGGQRSLARCKPWGCKQSDLTQQLNTTTNAESKDNDLSFYSMNCFQTENNFTDGQAVKNKKNSKRNLFLAKQNKGGLFWQQQQCCKGDVCVCCGMLTQLHFKLQSSRPPARTQGAGEAQGEEALSSLQGFFFSDINLF